MPFCSYGDDNLSLPSKCNSHVWFELGVVNTHPLTCFELDVVNICLLSLTVFCLETPLPGAGICLLSLTVFCLKTPLPGAGSCLLSLTVFCLETPLPGAGICLLSLTVFCLKTPLSGAGSCLLSLTVSVLRRRCQELAFVCCH